MTRDNKSKKSTALTAVMALIVLLAMGIDDVYGDHEVDRLVHEFGELLEGVEAEILSTPNDMEPSVDTTDTMQTGKILSDIAYLKVFDEVIQKQIL